MRERGTMLETDELVTYMYNSIASWFTPTYLFCFLNLMILTIYIAFSFENRVKSITLPFYTISTTQLARAPSLWERVKSINKSSYQQNNQYPLTRADIGINTFTSQEDQEHDSNASSLTRAPLLLKRVKLLDFSLKKQTDQQSNTGSNQHLKTAKTMFSEKSMVNPIRVLAKMKRCASEKGMVLAEWEAGEDVEKRRPATVREGKKDAEVAAEVSGEEGGVDSKADDFIIMFRKQLKLQRLKSLLRYNEEFDKDT